MASYRVRHATVADVGALVGQRVAMFLDMGMPVDVPAIEAAYGKWLRELMADGTYHGWLVETDSGEIVAGGGATIIPWPPGPWSMGDRLAFVYNVYTAPAHRHRGLARRVMRAIHEWCRLTGIPVIGLNASRAGRPLYESLGYAETPSPMMVIALTDVNA
jgi:GNAT superfamily N-acetyltransferase